MLPFQLYAGSLCGLGLSEFVHDYFAHASTETVLVSVDVQVLEFVVYQKEGVYVQEDNKSLVTSYHYEIVGVENF